MGTLPKRICHLSFANGYLSFADSRGFGLRGPDRRAEDAGRFTIFLDEVLDQCGRSHPSFQNNEQSDAGLIELFDGASEFMCEVGTALRTPRFAVVRGGRSARAQDLAGNMTPGGCFRQVPEQFNSLYRKRHQPALERVRRQQLETQYPPHLLKPRPLPFDPKKK